MYIVKKVSLNSNINFWFYLITIDLAHNFIHINELIYVTSLIFQLI